jgi:hypothetical protein
MGQVPSIPRENVEHVTAKRFDLPDQLVDTRDPVLPLGGPVTESPGAEVVYLVCEAALDTT